MYLLFLKRPFLKKSVFFVIAFSLNEQKMFYYQEVLLYFPSSSPLA